MVYQEIRKRLPFQIANKTGTGSSSYDDIYNIYDVAIGGIPFKLKIDQNNPFVRSTAQFKKQQLDTSAEPGEQTLTGWWLRSQSSFHWGSGLKYGDPELDPTALFRYYTSEGVNPWTPGQVTLLPSTSLIKAASGAVKLVTGLFSGTEVYYRISGNDVLRGTSAGSETTILSGASPVLDITTDGDDVYFGTGTKIKKASHGSTTVTDEWDVTATTMALGWVKQRIVVGVNNAIYVPTIGTAALPAAVYTHPNSAWVWTDVAEGPEAIYVSGYVGSKSVIIRLTLDETGAVPTLSLATVVAELPTGEVVNAMKSYLGTFLGLATNKGVRVATFQSNGALLVGPLIETPASVACIEARGTHFLAGYSNSFSDGDSGLLRVDLSTQFETGQFPYAPDLQAHVEGSVDSIGILSTSDQVVFGVTDSGIYKEGTDLESDGFIQTAAQRYNTVWPKLFKRFNVRGDFTGSMGVSTIDDSGTETSILNVSTSVDQTQDFAINYPDSPQEFLSLKFTLNRNGSDATVGTTFRSYQLKAIPGGPRPRQYTLPCLCFDYERGEHETISGSTGWALERLLEIEALDSAGDVVLYEDLKQGTAELCTIEAIEFNQVQPMAKNDSRYGGILTIVLRTLSA
jgi:hypothetical protein